MDAKEDVLVTLRATPELLRLAIVRLEAACFTSEAPDTGPASLASRD
jgi:hypothetical protein